MSTENMLQNYAGLEPYTEDTIADGIAIFCNDTLLANIRPYLKKVWKSEFDGACSTDVLAFSPEQIEPGFLYSLIAQDSFIDYVMSGAKGSKMPRGDKGHIMDFVTHLPTEAEQRKISSFIELINKRIALQDQHIEHLKKYKRGVTEAIFKRKIRFSDASESFPDWTTKKVGEICKIQTGKSNTQDELENGQYDFYVRSPIIRKSNRYLFDCEAVLTVGDGVGTGKVFHYVDGKFDLHQRVYAMTNFSDVSGKYFYYYFSHFFYDRVMRMTAKTSVDSVRYEMIDQMDIMIPCGKEQNLIVEYLSFLDNTLENIEKMLNLSEALKKGLLQQLFI